MVAIVTMKKKHGDYKQDEGCSHGYSGRKDEKDLESLEHSRPFQMFLRIVGGWW